MSWGESCLDLSPPHSRHGLHWKEGGGGGYAHNILGNFLFVCWVVGGFTYAKWGAKINKLENYFGGGITQLLHPFSGLM